MREADYDTSDSLDALLPVDDRTPASNAVGRSILRQDSVALKQALEQLRGNVREGYSAYWTALYEGDVNVAQDALEIMAASPERSDQAAILGAQLELVRGRWRAFQERSAELPAASVAAARRGRITAALLPFMPVPNNDLRAIRAEVEAGDSVSDRTAAHAANALRGEERLYTIASISCRLGEHDRALALAQRIEQAEVPPQYREITQRLAQEIRAQVAARQGDYQKALAILEGTDPTTMLELSFTHIGGGHQPYWRAEVLYQLGRDDEALTWLKHGFAANVVEVLSFGYTNLRQGEIYERDGDPEAAAKHYARAIAYWGDADAPLQAEVARARERLAALTQEVRR